MVYDSKKLPFLGVCYDAENLSSAEIAGDISMMKQAGITVVLTGTKSWYVIEKNEGKYDFSFYHVLLSQLQQNGISVVFAIPAAYPPMWLFEKYGDIPVTLANRQPLSPAAPNSACCNNPNFIGSVKKFVQKLVSEFSCYNNIIGWQLANSLKRHGRGCFCFYCRSSFSEYLKRKRCV